MLCCFVGPRAGVDDAGELGGVAVFHAAAVALFWVGAAGQLGFGVYRTGRLWTGGRDPLATTPVLYLPTVAGSFVSTIVAGALGWTDLGRLFFGAGLFSWLALESVIISRFYLQAEMPAALRPTFGIQLAPAGRGLRRLPGGDQRPAGLVFRSAARLRIVAGADPRAACAVDRSPAFAPSYWAFSFGVAALSLGSLRLVERGLDTPGFHALAVGLFILANLVIGGIALGSVWRLATVSARGKQALSRDFPREQLRRAKRGGAPYDKRRVKSARSSPRNARGTSILPLR